MSPLFLLGSPSSPHLSSLSTLSTSSTSMQQSLHAPSTGHGPGGSVVSAVVNSHLSTMYATKRRRRNSKNLRLKDSTHLAYNGTNMSNGGGGGLPNGNGNELAYGAAAAAAVAHSISAVNPAAAGNLHGHAHQLQHHPHHQQQQQQSSMQSQSQPHHNLRPGNVNGTASGAGGSAAAAAAANPSKTNPSKRHRERLNSELDTLASLLPFDQSVLSKLDKLSILRLSVSYLRTKSYFLTALRKDREAQQAQSDGSANNSLSSLILAKNNNYNSSGRLRGGVSPAASASSSPHMQQHQQQHHLHHHHHHHVHHLHHFAGNNNNSSNSSPSSTKASAAAGAAGPLLESLLEGDQILQALNGFLLILTCEGEVFYTSHTVETYLGFHQSDICHQSVYELVHSEDREELQRHLMWNSSLPVDRCNAKLLEVLQPENCHLLERNFTVRFRCLLDNTSGFLRLDVRGRIKVLYGQNHKTEEPPMALFAVCTPFGPPSLLEMPANEKALFKSKHKLDFSLISMEHRGRTLLGYSELELTNKGGYDLIHQDDLMYVASAHQELIKTGASGLIAYRIVTKGCAKWQWLQTSARLVHKNSKPDFILCTHRPLMEEEGCDLLSKRTMDFKVTYLDGGLGPITVNKNTDGLLQSACGYIVDINESASGGGNNDSQTTTTTATASGASRTTTNKLNRSNKGERTDSRSGCLDLNSTVVEVGDDNSNSTTPNGSRMTGKCHEVANAKLARDNYANEANTHAAGRRGKYNTKPATTTHAASKSAKGNVNKKLKASNNTSGSGSSSSAFEPIVPYGHGGRLVPDTVTSPNESTAANSFLLGYNSTGWTSAAVNPYFGLEDPSTVAAPTAAAAVHLPENTIFPTHLAHHHQSSYPHHAHHHPAAAAATSHLSTLAGHSNSAALAAAAAVYYHSSYPGQDSSYSHFVTPPTTTPSTANYSLSTSEPVAATTNSNSNELASTSTTNSSANFATQSAVRPSTFFSAENLLHYGARHPLVSVNNTYHHNGSGAAAAAAAAAGTDIYSAAAAVAMHHQGARQYPTAAAAAYHSSANPYHAGAHYSMQSPAVELTHYGGETTASNTANTNANNNNNNSNNDDASYRSLVSSEFASGFEHHNASNAYRFGGSYHHSSYHHQTANLNETYAGNAHHHHHHHSLKLANTSTGSGSNNSSSNDASTFYGGAHLAPANEMPVTPFLGYGNATGSSCRLAGGGAVVGVGGENGPAGGGGGGGADSSLSNLASFNQLHPLWNSFNMLTANLTLEHMKENTTGNNNIEMSNGVTFGETSGDQTKFGRKRKAKGDVLGTSQTPESLSLSLSVHPMTDTPPASASSSSSSSNAAIEELGAGVTRKHESPDPMKEASGLAAHAAWDNNNMCTQQGNMSAALVNNRSMMPNVTAAYNNLQSTNHHGLAQNHHHTHQHQQQQQQQNQGQQQQINNRPSECFLSPSSTTSSSSSSMIKSAQLETIDNANNAAIVSAAANMIGNNRNNTLTPLTDGRNSSNGPRSIEILDSASTDSQPAKACSISHNTSLSI